MFTFIKDKNKKCQHYAIDCEYHTDDENHNVTLDREYIQTKCVYSLLILLSIPIAYKIILYFTT
jgi:hypothetical protein